MPPGPSPGACTWWCRRPSFNPCCSGSCPPGAAPAWADSRPWGFNPCCSGSCPPGQQVSFGSRAWLEVSILVVVDHAPRDCSGAARRGRGHRRSFNPCCSGSCPPGVQRLLSARRAVRFNPCCSGSCPPGNGTLPLPGGWRGFQSLL